MKSAKRRQPEIQQCAYRLRSCPQNTLREERSTQSGSTIPIEFNLTRVCDGFVVKILSYFVFNICFQAKILKTSKEY